jgi:hypothetical protein
MLRPVSEHGERRNRNRMVIHSPDGARVLIAIDDGRARLPGVETSGHWHAMVAPVAEAMRAQLRLDITIRRCLAIAIDGDVADVAYLADAADAQAAPGFRWATIDGAAPARFEDARDRAAVEAARDVLERPHELQQPWMRPGWPGEAMAWCREALDARGFRVSGTPHQVKHWGIASIWRIPTESGDAWFKAVPPMFAHEGATLALLHDSMPAMLPGVIAHDRARGWALMSAIPQATPGPDDHAAHESAVRALTHLQIAWRERTTELIAAGCGDRRISSLPAGFDELCAAAITADALTAEEMTMLRGRRERIVDMANELSASGVGDTLVHGDFHADNVAVEGDRLVIFDWTDACVGPPFFDLATYLPRDPVDRAALWATYLEPWRAVIDGPALDRAADLSEPLACVHHALSYARIAQSYEPGLRWEIAGGLEGWLERLLALTAPLDAGGP